MNKSFSVYLDLVRFAAACLVYLYHSNQRWLVSKILPASDFGHSAVVVFFVLSGFVIAYVTHEKEKDWTVYAASRISRIYSVALPAVVLTLILDLVGRRFSPEIYDYPFDHHLLRVAASLALMNEWWFVSITSFSNVPFWSICYEGWYYVGFGLVMFLPRRSGVMAVALLGLFLGPKILLLAPLWAAGVLLYRWPRLRTLCAATSWALVLGSWGGLMLFFVADIPGAESRYFQGLLGAKWYAELTFSKFFAADYLLGLLIFANFAGMRRVAETISPLLCRIEAPVRHVAQYTFTLYLLHQPLMLFWGALVPGDPSGSAYWWRTTGLVVLSVLGVGYFTESQRHVLKRWTLQWLVRLQTRFQAGTPQASPEIPALGK